MATAAAPTAARDGQAAFSASEPAGREIHAGIPLAALAACALLLHLPLLLSPADTPLGGQDITSYFLYLHSFTRDHLLRGEIPLWNPHIFAGTPHAANPQNTVFYPPSWLYLAMPVAQAHKWMIFLHACLAGGFMFLYLRTLGLTRLAAFGGSLPYMCGGYFMANAAVGHLPMIFTMAWLPLALCAYERFLAGRGRVWLAAAGAVMGVQLLAGEPQNSYYTLLLLALYGLVRALKDRGASPGRACGAWLLQGAAIGAVAFCAAGIQALPTLEFSAQSDRAENEFKYVAGSSMTPGDFLSFFLPWQGQSDRALGFDKPGLLKPDKSLDVTFRWIWESSGYAGLLTLCLAALSARRAPSAALLSAWLAAAAAIVMMLGSNTPIYQLLYHALPGLKLFRIPARAMVILQWGLAVMAAFGLDALAGEAIHRPWLRWGRLACAALIFSLIGCLLVGLLSGKLLLIERDDPLSREVLLRVARFTISHPRALKALALAAISAGYLAAFARIPAAWRLRAAILILAVDLALSAPRIPLAAPPSAQEAKRAELARLIRREVEARPEPFRVDLSPLSIEANRGMEAGFENVNGYWPFSSGRFLKYIYKARGGDLTTTTRHEIPWQAYETGALFPVPLLNVGLASWLNPASKSVELQVPAKTMPRAWIVYQSEAAASDAEALERVVSPSFPAESVALIAADAPPLGAKPEAPPRPCHVRRISSSSIEIAAETDAEAYLILSEVHYPGWKAYVNGKRTGIERADYLLSAIRLPPGIHKIVYRYDPMSYKLGAALSFIACLALAGLFLQRRTRPASKGTLS